MIPVQEDDDGAVRLFGPRSWGHPSLEKTKTPVGEPCFFCEVPIADGDFGVTQIYAGEKVVRIAEHRACFLKSLGVGEEGT